MNGEKQKQKQNKNKRVKKEFILNSLNDFQPSVILLYAVEKFCC